MKKSRPILSFLIWSTIAGFFGALLLLSGMYVYLSPRLPSVESLKNTQFQTPLRIFTKDDKLMAEFGEKRRRPVEYEDVPEKFYQALIAAEDENFYEHQGIDIKGLLRAAYVLVTTGGKKKIGGSTLTMQVARNFYLTRKKTFSRKFTEILLAIHIEQELSKQEILELYVNKMYLGKRAYGVQAAAYVYYGKDIRELTLAQLAMIAGLPQSPSAANPINNPNRALKRRSYVLRRMFELNMITEDELTEAVLEPITATYHGMTPEVYAPYIAEMVRDEMVERYGENAYTDGYRVYTTVQSNIQEKAQEAVQVGVLAYNRKHGYHSVEANHPPTILEEDRLLPAEDWNPDDIQMEPYVKGPSWQETVELPPTPDNVNRFQWAEKIKPVAEFKMLKPAVVTEISDEDKIAKLVLKDGSEHVIPWQGIVWARAYVHVNQVGARIRKVSQVLNVGDQIWVTQVKNDDPKTKEIPFHWYLSQLPKAQSSLVSLDPYTGAVEALIGGFSFKQSKYNRAIQADRQPGSSFKPFIYSSALENGFTPASIINDAPVVFKDDSLESMWRPENYSGKFFGPTRLREALYKSRNLVSIRILRQMGIGKTVRFIQKFGFPDEKLNRDLSLALGASAVTPLEVAVGYTGLANGGYKVEPFVITRIDDEDGITLYEHSPITACEACLDDIQQAEVDLRDQIDAITPEMLREDPTLAELLVDMEANIENQLAELREQYPPLAERIMDERVNFVINDMLQDVIKRGTGKRALVLKRGDLAGKTGTTNDQKDAWFSGYNQDLVTTVWVGFDQPSTLGRNAFGGSTALPIWIDFMGYALNGKPERFLQQPDGLIMVRIDPETGERARPGQADGIFEIFKEENAPSPLQESTAENFDPIAEGEDPLEDEEEEAAPEQLF